jgi:hypothetical protein
MGSASYNLSHTFMDFLLLNASLLSGNPNSTVPVAVSPGVIFVSGFSGVDAADFYSGKAAI